MRQRRSTRLRALAAGALGTIALVVGVTTWAVVALDATRADVDAVARSTERSTYLIGDLGRQRIGVHGDR